MRLLYGGITKTASNVVRFNASHERAFQTAENRRWWTTGRLEMRRTKDIFFLIHSLRILPIFRLIFASDFTAFDAVDGKGMEDKPRYTVWTWLMERYDGKWINGNVIVESPLPCDNGT